MNWLEDMFSEISERAIGNEKRPPRKSSASEVRKAPSREEDRYSDFSRQSKSRRRRRANFHDWT